MRQFVVSLPEDLSTPRPVLVVLTGTLQPTLNFLTSNAFENDLLPAGWILLSPVHVCATSAEQVSTEDCEGAGASGWQAASWNDAASTGAAGMQWWSDPGPDARFLEAMVQCAASEWPVDPNRLFLAGVSGGATLINRVLTFRPEFWAGGLPVEGQWHTRPDDNDVNEMPDRIYEGRCCPIPLPSALAPMVVVTVFGGWQDGIFFYAPGAGAQAASNYFASMKDVVHLACMGQWGHRWPPLRESGREFNLWMASVFMAHPKGSDPNSFQWPAPPEGVECQLGRFTRLFPPDPVDP